MPKGGFWSRRGWKSGPAAVAKRLSLEQSGVPASTKELQRRAEFCKAVRAYDWDGALALAANEQETVDVADSKNRVDWMEYFLAQGDSMQAMLYAITSEERQRAEGRSAASSVKGTAASSVKGTATTEVDGDPPSRRRSTLSSRMSSIGNAIRRKSENWQLFSLEAGELSSRKQSSGEVHLQAGRV